MRESPALTIIQELEKRGAHVAYMDPYVPELDDDGLTRRGIDAASSFASFAAVVIVTVM